MLVFILSAEAKKKIKMLIKLFSVNDAAAFDENELLNENRNSALVLSCPSTAPSSPFFGVGLYPSLWTATVAEIYLQGELAPVTWNIINGFVTVPINCIRWTSIIALTCNLLKTSRWLVIYILPLISVTSNYIIAFHFTVAFALHNSFHYFMCHGSQAD